MAKARLEGSWEKHNNQSPIYLLDLISYRDVSNQIASNLGIEHQSPQLILIKEGRAVYDASHSAISAETAASYI